MDITLVNKTIEYWLGKPNNPLTGKTFKEIEQLATQYGIENIGDKLNAKIGLIILLLLSLIKTSNLL